MKTRPPSEIARLTDAEADKFNAARAAGPRRCAEIGCGYACAPADTYCRNHGGNEAACGICGDVTCPGHDGRTGARLGPVAAVALADAGDHCSRCFRLIDVAEPIFGAIGQGIWCTRCNERSAVPACERCGAQPGAECDPALHDARRDRFDARCKADAIPSGCGELHPPGPCLPPVGRRTSALLRNAASMIDAQVRGFAVFAAELRVRALLLEQEESHVQRLGCCALVSRIDLLRAIGEVRS